MNAESQRRLHNLATIGTVFAVNPDDCTMRLQVGDNQTDWLPIPTFAAGAISAWRCPSIGEQFLLISPSGDLSNAIPTVCLYSDLLPSPSKDSNELRIRYNDNDFLSINIADSTLTLHIGSTHIESDLVNIMGNLHVNGTITADKDVKADNISLKSHKHGQVKGGLDTSGGPQ